MALGFESETRLVCRPHPRIAAVGRVGPGDVLVDFVQATRLDGSRRIGESTAFGGAPRPVWSTRDLGSYQTIFLVGGRSLVVARVRDDPYD